MRFAFLLYGPISAICVTVYGENGGTPGFLSFTATIPSRLCAVTILTNHGSDLDNSKLTVPIVQALLR